MAPPKFGDLGKGAKDLIGKDYHHPLTKVELNSKTSNDVALKAAIDKNNTSNEIKGNFEAKFAYKPLNATITEKFNTSNVISQVITFADKGKKIEIDTSYALEKGVFNGRVTSEAMANNYHAHAVVDLQSQSVVGSSVFQYENLYFGAQTCFDYQKGGLKGHLAALGYSAKDTTFHALSDFSDTLTASVHHIISKRVQAAINVNVAKGKDGSMANKFGIGLHNKLDNNAYLKAKIDNNAIIGLSFTQALSKSVKFSLSMMLDSKNMNADTSKLGLNLVLVA